MKILKKGTMFSVLKNPKKKNLIKQKNFDEKLHKL